MLLVLSFLSYLHAELYTHAQSSVGYVQNKRRECELLRDVHFSYFAKQKRHTEKVYSSKRVGHVKRRRPHLFACVFFFSPVIRPTFLWSYVVLFEKLLFIGE